MRTVDEDSWEGRHMARAHVTTVPTSIQAQAGLSSGHPTLLFQAPCKSRLTSPVARCDRRRPWGLAAAACCAAAAAAARSGESASLPGAPAWLLLAPRAPGLPAPTA